MFLDFLIDLLKCLILWLDQGEWEYTALIALGMV